jgi:hypothetical protein
MHRKDNYEVLLKRSAECQLLAQVVRDMSIRKKSAELAKEYHDLADRLKDLEQMEQLLKRSGF